MPEALLVSFPVLVFQVNDYLMNQKKVDFLNVKFLKQKQSPLMIRRPLVLSLCLAAWHFPVITYRLETKWKSKIHAGNSLCLISSNFSAIPLLQKVLSSIIFKSGSTIAEAASHPRIMGSLRHRKFIPQITLSILRFELATKDAEIHGYINWALEMASWCKKSI